MFKKTVLALTAVAALSGATLAGAAPAAAYDGWYWGNHHNYHHDYRPHYWGHEYRPVRHDCYWAWRSVKVWTDDGPVWTQRKVQVCD